MLIKVTPNKEKAKSILKMVNTSLEMIEEINMEKFPSNVAKEYYDVIRELISIVLLLDGLKAVGGGAHMQQIEYLAENYREFDRAETELIDDLRAIRNKIAYDGFFVKGDYIKRKSLDISRVIGKLKGIVVRKL